MNLALKPELQKFIEEQVTAGRYRSAEDVVTAAVTRFMQDELLAVGEADLQRGDFVTMDDAREHFRRRAEASQPSE